MNKCCDKWVEKPKGSHSHTNSIHKQCPNKIGHNNTMTPLSYSQRFYELEQVISEKNDIGALTRYVCPRTHSYSNVCCHQCWSVINTISYHRNLFPTVDYLFDLSQFLVGKKFGLYVVYSKFFPNLIGNRLCITG